MRRFLAIALVLVLALSVLPWTGGHAQSGDGNSSGDAGNTQNQASHLPQGRWSGQLGPNDPADWYRFDVPSISSTQGRPKIEVLLRTDGPAVQRLDLFGRNDAVGTPGQEGDRPTATGRGTRAQGIAYSADRDGEWWLRITGQQARYELEFRFPFENDGNRGRDAPNHEGANGEIRITGNFAKGVVVHGNFTPGETVDIYRFALTGGDNRLFASLYFAPTLRYDVELTDPDDPAVDPSNKRTGPGAATDFETGVSKDLWAVRVRSLDAAQGGPYILTVAANPVDDAAGGPDAPAGKTDASFALTPGLSTGTLTDPADGEDGYKLTGVVAGERIFVGVGSLPGGQTGILRLSFVATLHSPTGEVHRFVVCDSAQSVAYTANAPGTWYVVVRVSTAAECGDLRASTGRYMILLERSLQREAGVGDAPKTTTAAPRLAVGPVNHGWLDRSDDTDHYEIDHLERGDVVRAAYMSEVRNLDVNISLVDNFGQVVALTTSSGGVAGLHTSTSHAGFHYLRITTHRPANVPFTESPYRFFLSHGPNEAPQASILSVPENGVTRNTVLLQWTTNADADFNNYELHQGTSTTFTPTAATLIGNFTQRTKSDHTATGLEAGRSYTFLLRTRDESGLSIDSNRVTRTTDSSFVGNQPPTLANGRVDPAEGDASTLFTWKVTYTDGNNDPPRTKRVFIDGIASNMQSSDTTYNDGAVFEFSKTLPPGSHSFFFEFDDDDDPTAVARDPTTGSRSGPLVTQQGNRPPTVTGSANPAVGDAPLKVTFTADATDPDGNSISYCWDFDVNDGSQCQSSQRIAEHTYQEAGKYTATITARDSNQATASDSVTVEVREPQNKPPVANPKADPDNGLAPLTVKFTANAHDLDGSISKYSWDFNNGDGLQEDSTVADPTHTYSNPGSFVATLTVTDNGGRTATGSVRVLARSADNQPPSGSIVATPTRGAAPLAVEFEADSFDADGDAIFHHWDFNMKDGIQEDATGVRVSHSYGQAGRYTVLLTVRDGRGAQSTATTEIVVLAPQGTSGALFIQATPAQGRAPLRVTFQADTSGLGAPAASYAWDFGDGSAVDNNATPVHTYTSQGRWTTTLRLTDTDGVLYESTIEVNVMGASRGSGTPGLTAVALLAILAGVAVGARRRG